MPISEARILGYQNLKAHQEAHALVKLVYEVTKDFPRSELFGLVSQMRRAAVSVPANIVEGYGRGAKKEFHHFVSIAKGSLSELEYYIELSLDLGYINNTQSEQLKAQRLVTGALLGGLYRSLGR